MGAYAQLFHSLGYNTLLPDAESSWAKPGQVCRLRLAGEKMMSKKVGRAGDQEKMAKKSKIVIFGVSMGGANDHDDHPA